MRIALKTCLWTFLLPVMLASVGCSAASISRLAMLEDVEPPVREADESLRHGSRALPLQQEVRPFRARPEDPRLSSMLQDLEVSKKESGPAEKPGTPVPLPEERRPESAGGKRPG